MAKKAGLSHDLALKMIKAWNTCGKDYDRILEVVDGDVWAAKWVCNYLPHDGDTHSYTETPVKIGKKARAAS